MAQTHPNRPGKLQHAKTIHNPLETWVGLGGIVLAADAANFNVSAPLSTALGTAGRNGVAVPLQPSTDTDTPGVVVDAARDNVVIIVGSDGRQAVGDEDGSEFYGRVTESAGAYTVDFFVYENGAEVAKDLPAGTYDLCVPYLFTFTTLPANAARKINVKRIGDDVRGAFLEQEELIATAQNTFPTLTLPKKPGGISYLDFYGKPELETYTNPSYTITGNVITWNAANAGYDIEAGEAIVVTYEV